MIALDPEDTDAGALERLFLIETRDPQSALYDRPESIRAMRVMKQVIDNRLHAPRKSRFGEPDDAESETDIIAVGNQFRGFGDYPVLPVMFKAKLALILQLASASNDKRSAIYAQFVQDAITAATEAAPPPGAYYPAVVAWRTEHKGSPGKDFRFVTTVQGNSFYAADVVPPMPQRRGHTGLVKK